MDIHSHKYEKYKNKNKNIGGNPLIALKAISMAKKTIKRGTDVARKNALKITKEIKKETEKEEMREILGENYDEVNNNLDDMIVILDIKSLKELYENKDKILEIANKINNILQESELDDNIKKQLEQIVSFANMMNSN